MDSIGWYLNWERLFPILGVCGVICRRERVKRRSSESLTPDRVQKTIFVDNCRDIADRCKWAGDIEINRNGPGLTVKAGIHDQVTGVLKRFCPESMHEPVLVGYQGCLGGLVLFVRKPERCRPPAICFLGFGRL